MTMRTKKDKVRKSLTYQFLIIQICPRRILVGTSQNLKQVVFRKRYQITNMLKTIKMAKNMSLMRLNIPKWDMMSLITSKFY